MAERSPSRERAGEEADWVPISEDDPLLGPPATLPPPLTVTAPPALNTDALDWESFERLVVQMARRMDGAYDARRYGRSGQAQHGLDVVGFFADRPPTVYQVKRWQRFSAADLRAAVELYLEGSKPFGLTRVVVAVSSEARDREILDELGRLREQRPDTVIELWDKDFISNALQHQPSIVATFFGRATAEVFCTIGREPTTRTQPSIMADVVMRGPLAHLELQEDVRRAESASSHDPAQAASLFGSVARRLEEAGFRPHAAPVRARQANALRDSGQRLEEAGVRIDLAWRYLDDGDNFGALNQARKIAEREDDDFPDAIIHSTNGFSTVATYRTEADFSLTDVADAFDEMDNSDPHKADAAIATAEAAVARRELDIIDNRADTLSGIADEQPATYSGALRSARLRMCLADQSGDWEQLSAAARDTYPPRIAALVHARHARYLALAGEAQASIARWRDAIERASMHELYDDAADWLYALRQVKLHFGRGWDEDLNEQHRNAQALRAAGRGTVLPEPYSARERALSNLQGQRWRAAYEAGQRYLERSALRADWTAELEANEILGDLFLQTQRLQRAAEHYITAGAKKKLKALADAVSEEAISVGDELIRPTPWERAAAFAYVASVGSAPGSVDS